MNETLAVEQTQIDDKQLAKIKLLFIVIIILVIALILVAVVFGIGGNENQRDDSNKENLDNAESYPESYIPPKSASADLEDEVRGIVGNRNENVITTSRDDIEFLQEIILTGGSYDAGLEINPAEKYKLICDEDISMCLVYNLEGKVILWSGYVNASVYATASDTGGTIMLKEYTGAMSGYRSLVVYEYDKQSEYLNEKDRIEANFMGDLCDGNDRSLCTTEITECFSGYNKIESYIKDGCFKDYFQNEPWFQINLEFLEKAAKYE